MWLAWIVRFADDKEMNGGDGGGQKGRQREDRTNKKNVSVSLENCGTDQCLIEIEVVV